MDYVYFFFHCWALPVFDRRYTVTACLLEHCCCLTKSHQLGHWLPLDVTCSPMGTGMRCVCLCVCVWWQQEDGWRNLHTSIPILTFPSLILADILVKHICVIEAKSRRKRDMCQLRVIIYIQGKMIQYNQIQYKICIGWHGSDFLNYETSFSIFSVEAFQ